MAKPPTRQAPSVPHPTPEPTNLAGGMLAFALWPFVTQSLTRPARNPYPLPGAPSLTRVRCLLRELPL